MIIVIVGDMVFVINTSIRNHVILKYFHQEEFITESHESINVKSFLILFIHSHRYPRPNHYPWLCYMYVCYMLIYRGYPTMAVTSRNKSIYIEHLFSTAGGIVLLLFKLVGSPYQRGFFCDDQSLMYPFHSSTVTSGMLYGIGFALAVFLVHTISILIILSHFTYNNYSVNALLKRWL